jgi:GrpB-like predicted nucleotidyltransferase (UPF0157 family)
MHLVPAEAPLLVARRISVQVRAQLNDLGVRGELEHVGGSSVPGALTRGLAADPGLVEMYNETKRSATDADYEARKSAFFDMVLARWPSHPAGGVQAIRQEGRR